VENNLPERIFWSVARFFPRRPSNPQEYVERFLHIASSVLTYPTTNGSRTRKSRYLVEALGGGKHGPLEEAAVGDGGEVEHEVADGDGWPRRQVGGGTPLAEDPKGQVLDWEVQYRGHPDER
jgi:hypothetical protein